jgi:hypothetical protein
MSGVKMMKVLLFRNDFYDNGDDHMIILLSRNIQEWEDILKKIAFCIEREAQNPKTAF